jgi:hypothetical protein
LSKDKLLRKNGQFHADEHANKIFIRPFLLFLIIMIAMHPHMTTVWGLQTASHELYSQRVNQITGVSHSAIAEKMKHIPSLFDDIPVIVGNPFTNGLEA